MCVLGWGGSPTSTHIHTCTRSCLAWKATEAAPNINYPFFSRGLVTAIRGSFFGELPSNEENRPLQEHLIRSAAPESVCVCV